MIGNFKALKTGVHELLELTSVLILIAFLCIWNTLFHVHRVNPKILHHNSLLLKVCVKIIQIVLILLKLCIFLIV